VLPLEQESVEFQEEIKDLLAEKFNLFTYQRYQELRFQYQSSGNKISAI
jgi:hypothetical protein